MLNYRTQEDYQNVVEVDLIIGRNYISWNVDTVAAHFELLGLLIGHILVDTEVNNGAFYGRGLEQSKLWYAQLPVFHSQQHFN